MMTDERTSTTSPRNRLSGWLSSARDWLKHYGNSWLPLIAFFIASAAVLSIGVYVDRWWFWIIDIPAAVAVGALAFVVTWEEVR